MRIAHLLTLAGSAALSLCAAAEPANTANLDSATTTVNAACAAYPLRGSDLKAVQGTYALEDGRTLRVSAEHHKLYAEVDGARAEIFKVGATRFASRDDALRVSFDTADSVANEVTLSTPAAR